MYAPRTKLQHLYFYPRPPRGGRRHGCRHHHVRYYFYPRPPRGGRLVQLPALLPNGIISIHALREEGDVTTPKRACRWANFYPRPPRGGRRLFCAGGHNEYPNFYPRPPRGGRLISQYSLRCPLTFLSTPSARRATEVLNALTAHRTDFYPRPPRGGRQNTQTTASYTEIFLSTPSARRATARSQVHLCGNGAFLSTPSARRATECSSMSKVARPISIHALREEGDRAARRAHTSTRYFYPRPPRGGRPCAQALS